MQNMLQLLFLCHSPLKPRWAKNLPFYSRPRRSSWNEIEPWRDLNVSHYRSRNEPRKNPIHFDRWLSVKTNFTIFSPIIVFTFIIHPHVASVVLVLRQASRLCLAIFFSTSAASNSPPSRRPFSPGKRERERIFVINSNLPLEASAEKKHEKKTERETKAERFGLPPHWYTTYCTHEHVQVSLSILLTPL